MILCTFQGEEYKLFWPEQSEFVRMAARFGAKIVPFGVVGEDDFGEVSKTSFLYFPPLPRDIFYFRAQCTSMNANGQT